MWIVNLILFILWTNVLSAYVIRFWINLPKLLRTADKAINIFQLFSGYVERLLESNNYDSIFDWITSIF